MKDYTIIFIIIIILIGLLIGMFYFAGKETNEHAGYFEKGDGYCPNCGTKLVKGVYGAYSPHFVWYCPECP